MGPASASFIALMSGYSNLRLLVNLAIYALYPLAVSRAGPRIVFAPRACRAVFKKAQC
jgi:hypothetical protein